MSDSRRVYRAIKQALTQAYPDRPQGNRARHLETLVGMVSGIVLGKSCQLPKIASKVRGEVQPDSRTKQLSRWVQNEHITGRPVFSAVCGTAAGQFGGGAPAGVDHGWECRGARVRDLDGQPAVCPPRAADCLAGRQRG